MQGEQREGGAGVVDLDVEPRRVLIDPREILFGAAGVDDEQVVMLVDAVDQQVGTVASGSYAPYLKKNIGTVYLPLEHSGVGTELSIVIRGREVPARVVETPFYKRERRFD